MGLFDAAVGALLLPSFFLLLFSPFGFPSSHGTESQKWVPCCPTFERTYRFLALSAAAVNQTTMQPFCNEQGAPICLQSLTVDFASLCPEGLILLLNLTNPQRNDEVVWSFVSQLPFTRTRADLGIPLADGVDPDCLEATFRLFPSDGFEDCTVFLTIESAFTFDGWLGQGKPVSLAR